MTTIHPAAVATAAVAAGTLSGIPSTVHALATGASPLDAVRAAGTIAVRDDAPPATRVVVGLAAHSMLSLGWAAVLAAILPRRHPVLGGALAGLGIAVVDLGVASRRYPAIAALPRGAQVADHVAFGVIAGYVLGRARRCAHATTRPGARSAPG